MWASGYPRSQMHWRLAVLRRIPTRLAMQIRKADRRRMGVGVEYPDDRMTGLIDNRQMRWAKI